MPDDTITNLTLTYGRDNGDHIEVTRHYALIEDLLRRARIWQAEQKQPYRTEYLVGWLSVHGAKHHRDDGPAVIMRSDDGYLREEYLCNGKHHREDGPAIVEQSRDGPSHTIYYQNDKQHREDGPAFVARYPDGSRLEIHCWDGKLHREHGPAFIATGPNGKFIAQKWYNHGELIKEEKGDWIPPSGMQSIKATLDKNHPGLPATTTSSRSMN